MTTPKKQHGKWEVTLAQHRALDIKLSKRLQRITRRVEKLEELSIKLINFTAERTLLELRGGGDYPKDTANKRIKRGYKKGKK